MSSSSSSSLSSSSSSSAATSGAATGAGGPAKAPRLTGNEAFDKGAQDDLAGVLTRLISGFTGSGGVADLEIESGDAHLVARKFWRDAAGGPRIELLEIEAGPFFAIDGWLAKYEKLPLQRGALVRVKQTLSASPANSAMVAAWMLGHALASFEDPDNSSLTAKLRVFDFPESELEINKYLVYGGEMGFEPWMKGWKTEIDSIGKVIDVEKMKIWVEANRVSFGRKRAALEALVRTWEKVEVPISGPD